MYGAKHTRNDKTSVTGDKGELINEHLTNGIKEVP